MKGFVNILKHKYFAFSAVVMMVMLPLILVVNNQQKETRSQAEASTTLTFNPVTLPNTPLQKKVGDNFYLDIMLNPGKNLVSLIKLDITYDPAKISLSSTNPLVVNSEIFPQILEGPVYSTGRIQVVLSVGSDLSKAISTQSRAATVNFVANSPASQTLVSFGTGTSVSSVASTDLSGENVLSTTSPAYITISKATGKNGGAGNGGGKGKPTK